MHVAAPNRRLVLAVKGAILWVLVAPLFGALPSFVAANDASFGIFALGIGFGCIGAVAHTVVVLLLLQWLPSKWHVAAADGLAIGLLVVLLTYGITGGFREAEGLALVAKVLQTFLVATLPALVLAVLIAWLLWRESAA